MLVSLDISKQQLFKFTYFQKQVITFSQCSRKEGKKHPRG